jgi:hypothetical protein
MVRHGVGVVLVAVALASFLSELRADAAAGEETAPAQDLAASLKRLNFQLEGAATSLRRDYRESSGFNRLGLARCARL